MNPRPIIASIRRYTGVIAFAGLVILGEARAVNPPPDGGYPGANTAEGQSALLSLTSGGYNTAVGWSTLRSDTTGAYNTALGAGALVLNAADGNTAIGAAALLNNTTGVFNTANGVLALFHNTEGEFNTGIGSFVLANNTTGTGNMAMGDSALLGNTTGSQNVAIGVSALRNSNGTSNVAIGHNASVFSSNGNSNVGIGAGALGNNGGDFNTAIGNDAGYYLTGSSNICIGSEVTGVAGESNTIRIGDNLPSQTGQSACYIGGIYNQLYGPDGTPCYVDPDGKLSVFFSARRFKTAIADMGAASKGLLALRPVTFQYKPEFDKTGTPQFGLVAEEVAAVNPDLVTRDRKGRLATVRYEAVNAMLLNEFLKEHKAFVQEQHKVKRLETAVRKLVITVNEQASELRKVKAEVHMTKPMMRVAAENP
jgi:hypothetical protein